MDGVRGLGFLPDAEISDRAVGLALHLVTADGTARLKVVQEFGHIAHCGRQDARLQGERLPFKQPLVVCLVPQSDQERDAERVFHGEGHGHFVGPEAGVNRADAGHYAAPSSMVSCSALGGGSVKRRGWR